MNDVTDVEIRRAISEFFINNSAYGSVQLPTRIIINPKLLETIIGIYSNYEYVSLTGITIYHMSVWIDKNTPRFRLE